MPDPRSGLAAAHAHLAKGDDQAALPILLRAARAAPRDVDLLLTLSMALSRCAQSAQAEYHARRAAGVDPASPLAHVRLSESLAELRRFPEAAEAAEYAVSLAPNDPDIAARACMTLHLAGQYLDAVDLARRALAQTPAHPQLSARLSDSLNVLGRVEEAVRVLREACEQHPDVHFLATDLCAASTFDPSIDAAASLRLHQDYGRFVERLFPAPPARDWKVTRDPDKPLRLAVVSPDLRSHPVSTFFEPIARYADKSRLQIVCYFTGLAEDDVSRRLRSLVHAWKHVPVRSPANAARRLNDLIRADGADVLLECSGHSERHLLPLCRLQPAPVQITGLGWPNTTGVREVGWRITDSVVDPPPAEALSGERPLRLDPCFLCYSPLADAPEPGPSPAIGRGGVTFGCFNAGPKLNDEVLRLFARVLQRVRGSRLLLKHSVFLAEQGRAAVAERLHAAGAPVDRVEMLGPTPHREHLEALRRVDIALDTFPFNGATSTCDALFMGSPVVTLRSERIGARVGASLLSVVGLPECIAASPEQYEQIAVSLAEDLPRLGALRESLRARVLASPLCDAPAYAARFERAVRAAWVDWLRSSNSAHSAPPERSA